MPDATTTLRLLVLTGPEDRAAPSPLLELLQSHHEVVVARTMEEALQELKRCSGTQFDPVIVSAFLLAYEKGNIITNGSNSNKSEKDSDYE